MSNPSSNKGIDIQTALSILSERTKCNHHNHYQHSLPTNKVEEEYLNQATQGQVIQLYDEKDGDNTHNESKSNDDDCNCKQKELVEKEKKMLEEQQKQNEMQLKSKLNSMSTKELLQTTLQIQSDRVTTYKKFQSGLDVVLKTNNMTVYPVVCTNVTASFSLQSNTINTIKSILERRKEMNYVKLILKLQSFEKLKLDYTTACHLECIRLNHMKDDVDDGQYKNVRDLLDDGVKDLKRKINKCMEDINEVLDEIRCSLLEED